MPLILGIDPGLTRCGLALMDPKSEGLQASNVLKTGADIALVARIGSLMGELEQIMDSFAPSAIALERVFAQANLRSVMGVAQISGAVMAAAHKRGIGVEFYTPTEVKLAVTGNGRATKAEVIAAISRFYPERLQTNYADEADAVAIALCASRKSSTNQTPAQRRWQNAARLAKGKLG